MEKRETFMAEKNIFDYLEEAGWYDDKHQPLPSNHRPKADDCLAILLRACHFSNPIGIGKTPQLKSFLKRAQISIFQHLEESYKPPEFCADEDIQKICNSAVEVLSLNEVKKGILKDRHLYDEDLLIHDPYAILFAENEHPKIEYARKWLIGDNASIFLDINRDFSFEQLEATPRKIPYQFQNDWLNGVENFLSSKEESVMLILPFLLTCYTIAIPRIRHNSENVNNKNLRSQCQKLSQYFFPLNFDKKNLNFFWDIPDYHWYDKTSKSEFIGKDLLQLSLPFTAVKPRNKNEYEKSHIKWAMWQDDMRDAMRCWELYKRFCGFAWACRKIEAVNLTLSLVLFASMFNFYDYYPKIGKKQEVPYQRRNQIVIPLHGLSWKNVLADKWRGRICNIANPAGKILTGSTEHDATQMSVYQMAYYMNTAFYFALQINHWK